MYFSQHAGPRSGNWTTMECVVSIAWVNIRVSIGKKKNWTSPDWMLYIGRLFTSHHSILTPLHLPVSVCKAQKLLKVSTSSRDEYLRWRCIPIASCGGEINDRGTTSCHEGMCYYSSASSGYKGVLFALICFATFFIKHSIHIFEYICGGRVGLRITIMHGKPNVLYNVCCIFNNPLSFVISVCAFQIVSIVKKIPATSPKTQHWIFQGCLLSCIDGPHSVLIVLLQGFIGVTLLSIDMRIHVLRHGLAWPWVMV